MIMNWLQQEGWMIISWWLLATAAGVAVLPLCWRLLRALPDRGYTLSRPLGMLLTGFVFWLLASFGFLQNTTGSMLLAWLIVLGVGLVIYFRARTDDIDFRTYWQKNRATIIVAEILFFVLFFGWSLYRAYQNDTGSTEKPMELMFISSIMRSDQFPPADGWMAGYSISYYYFGYVMSAMMSMLSGVSSTFGFSLTSALWFALSGLSVFGVVSNVVRAAYPLQTNGQRISRALAPMAAGLLGVVFLLFMSNFQMPLIELPYQSQSASPTYLDFWRTQERTSADLPMYEASNPPLSFVPVSDFSRDWWWFRASRVLRDYQLDGSNPPAWYAQPISEFPNFSFVLGDNHPHVLALPFVLMTLGLAFNLLRGLRSPSLYQVLLYALVVGGLIFLNTWDGPIGLAIFVGAEVLRRYMARAGWLMWWDWFMSAVFGVGLLVVAFVAYLPFFVGFRSQAQGIVPNPLYPTYFPQFFIMFGPFILLAGAYLLLEVWRGQRSRRMNWRTGILGALGVFGGLFVFMMFLVILGALFNETALIAQRFVQESGGWGEVLPQLIARRIAHAPTMILLLLAVGLIVARLFARHRETEETNVVDHDPIRAAAALPYTPSSAFALLIMGAAVTLLLVPEFIYLRDNFGTRINTIFKFYYQAWAMLSVVSAFGFYAIISDFSAKRPALPIRITYGAVLSVVLCLGLIYPIFATYARAVNERGRDYLAVEEHPPLTLDGGSRMPLNEDDYQAVMCLGQIAGGTDTVAVEAVRDAYRSNYGRVAALTGVPILLGWEGHENQWRGATYGEIAGTRRPDIDRLYTDVRWDTAIEIINRYDIDYIMYGATERAQYGDAGEEKFATNLQLVCDYGSSHVYAVGETPLQFNVSFE